MAKYCDTELYACKRSKTERFVKIAVQKILYICENS